MPKFECPSFNTSKVTAFLWKVATSIFVKRGQRPYKSVKFENDIAFSLINIFQQNVWIGSVF